VAADVLAERDSVGGEEWRRELAYFVLARRDRKVRK
jgi:hypothetical protein